MICIRLHLKLHDGVCMWVGFCPGNALELTSTTYAAAPGWHFECAGEPDKSVEMHLLRTESVYHPQSTHIHFHTHIHALAHYICICLLNISLLYYTRCVSEVRRAHVSARLCKRLSFLWLWVGILFEILLAWCLCIYVCPCVCCVHKYYISLYHHAGAAGRCAN